MYNQYLFNLIRNKTIDTTTNIHWRKYEGVAITARKGRCNLIEDVGKQEHYVKSTLSARKGFNYVIFEYLPSVSEVNIKVKSDSFHGTLPLKVAEKKENNSFVMNRNNENNILPIVRQDIKKEEISKLKLIYFSKIKQNIDLFWYNGQKSSYMCPSYFGSFKKEKS